MSLENKLRRYVTTKLVVVFHELLFNCPTKALYVFLKLTTQRKYFYISDIIGAEVVPRRGAQNPDLESAFLTNSFESADNLWRVILCD